MPMNLRITIQQVWKGLKDSPSDSILHILGVAVVTAFASVMMVQIANRYVEVYPETNRDRILICPLLSEKYGGGTMSAGVSEAFNEYFIDGIPGVQCSDLAILDLEPSRFVTDDRSASLVGKYVGPHFWEIYDFRFIDGTAIPEDGYDLLSPQAVISASVARYLYGTEKAVGRKICLRDREIRICGVVADVPSMSVQTFAQIWLPKDIFLDGYSMSEDESVSGFGGNFTSVVLCRDKDDRDAVLKELESRIEAYNLSAQAEVELALPQGMMKSMEYADYVIYGESGNIAGKQFMFLLLLVFLVSVNITGLVSFRMKLKEEELGIRRSFGARRGHVISQIIGENLVLSIAGGLLGIIAGTAILFSFSDSFSSNLVEMAYYIFNLSVPAPYADVWTIFRPSAMAVLLLCVVLIALLSSLLPALAVSRKGIVNMIDKDE